MNCGFHLFKKIDCICAITDQLLELLEIEVYQIDTLMMFCQQKFDSRATNSFAAFWSWLRCRNFTVIYPKSFSFNSCSIRNDLHCRL